MALREQRNARGQKAHSTIIDLQTVKRFLSLSLHLHFPLIVATAIPS
jgi:hypothetical protein